MKRLFSPIALFFALVLVTFTTARAEETATQTRVPETFLVGNDFTLKTNEICRKISVTSGSATINGEVEENVSVTTGSALINGKLDHSLIVFLGSAKLGPNAEIKKDLVVIGGPLTIDPGAKIGGKRVDVFIGDKVPALAWTSDWLTKGFFLARPLPPRVGWVWVVAGAFLLINVMLTLMFPRPLQACVEAMERRPIGAFFTGLLVLILFGPLVALLGASGVGIPIIPLVLCAFFAAFLLGKVSLYRYAGQKIGRPLNAEALQRPLPALVAGTGIFYLLYTLPVIGMVVWGMISLTGMGAVVIAMATGMKRETDQETAPAVVPPPMRINELGQQVIDEALLPRVGFWMRFLAMCIDLVLFFIVAILTHNPVIALLFWLTYHVVMWERKGATIGGMILGFKIVRIDGRRMDWVAAIVRSLGSVFSALVLGIGFFWAGWTREKQSWHDKIAGTIAVRTPRGVSLV